MSKTWYEMEVRIDDERDLEEAGWVEPVPDSLKDSNAPNIENLCAYGRAKVSVKWRNEKTPDLDLKLVSVTRIDRMEITPRDKVPCQKALKPSDLQPGDRILIYGECFPDDEAEVVQEIGVLKGKLRDGDVLVKYVQRPIVFVLGPETRFNKIEGLP